MTSAVTLAESAFPLQQYENDPRENEGLPLLWDLEQYVAVVLNRYVLYG